MSWDLEVFAPERPEPGEDAEELARRGVSVDGPLEVEDEDLPQAVATALLIGRWTVQISVSAGATKTAAGGAERLARTLARDSSGVVYDPQQDRIVWPRSVKRLRQPVVSRETADDAGDHVLELQWMVGRRLGAGDAEALLDILERDLPEALPRRFGDYEPMQGRLERDGRAPFTEMWDGPSGPFWKGLRPFEFGSVWLRRDWGSALTPEEREARRPVLGGRKAIEVDAIHLDFKPDVIHDERWLDALANLFVRVAAALSPFFAAAWLRPDSGSALMGRYWLGIPDLPLWMIWVGPPYLELLPPRLPEHAERSSDHVLLRAPCSPADTDALERNAIEWPPELMRRPGDFQDERLAARVIPNLAG